MRTGQNSFFSFLFIYLLKSHLIGYPLFVFLFSDSVCVYVYFVSTMNQTKLPTTSFERMFRLKQNYRNIHNTTVCFMKVAPTAHCDCISYMYDDDGSSYIYVRPCGMRVQRSAFHTVHTQHTKYSFECVLVIASNTCSCTTVLCCGNIVYTRKSVVYT